jgi:hypothetical protein
MKRVRQAWPGFCPFAEKALRARGDVSGTQVRVNRRSNSVVVNADRGTAGWTAEAAFRVAVAPEFSGASLANDFGGTRLDRVRALIELGEVDAARPRIRSRM